MRRLCIRIEVRLSTEHATNSIDNVLFLARDRPATRIGVACGDRPVDANEQTRIVWAVGAGEAEEVGAGGTRTPGHRDLRAREVELRPTDRAGAVESNVLEADEIFSVRNAARDGHGEAGRVVGGPADARARNTGTFLVNLEPNGTLAVEGSSRAGCLGKVDVDWARVGKGRVGIKRQARPSRNGQCLGRRGAGAQLVACHLRRGEVGHRAVRVMVLGAARVLPVRHRATT
jgi:hypothetical protein